MNEPRLRGRALPYLYPELCLSDGRFPAKPDARLLGICRVFISSPSTRFCAPARFFYPSVTSTTFSSFMTPSGMSVPSTVSPFTAKLATP